MYAHACSHPGAHTQVILFGVMCQSSALQTGAAKEGSLPARAMLTGTCFAGARHAEILGGGDTRSVDKTLPGFVSSVSSLGVCVKGCVLMSGFVSSVSSLGRLCSAARLSCARTAAARQNKQGVCNSTLPPLGEVNCGESVGGVTRCGNGGRADQGMLRVDMVVQKKKWKLVREPWVLLDLFLVRVPTVVRCPISCFCLCILTA